jgi:cyclopropane fatty-acyl-phospholipid synthase-like methyltransferase
MPNIKTTIEFYEEEAINLIDAYNSADMAQLHKLLKTHLSPNCKVLDIGFGSGRELAFLKEYGCDIWGVDPVKQFVDYAKERFPDVKDHFWQGKLPDLDFPPNMQNSFDAVLLIAVWMHIPKEFYEESINKIKSLLKPNGKVILSYSTTPRKENSKRLFENINSLKLKELFNQNEFSQIDVVTNKDGLSKRSIEWRTEVYIY